MLTVYFVDDEEWLLREITAVIDWEAYGFEICGLSTDPFVAQEEIFAKNPDLVICDIYMDGLNGLQLAKSVSEQNPQIDFCFISAYDKFEYAVGAIKLGAVDYLTKPLKKDELLVVLDKVLKKKGEKEIESLVTGERLDAGAEKSGNEIVNLIVQDIELNYAEEQSLDAYAKKYGYNASYLSWLFKKEMKKSFLEYLISYRMTKAKELLSSTQQTISEIAYQVGYNDYYHFAKAFKQNVGWTPTEYREKYTK